MRTVHIDFFPDNLDLLKKGLKTTTLRSDSQAAKIGMAVQEKALFDGFIVHYLGKFFVDEIGGKNLVWISEGFDHTSTKKPKFQQTVDFLEGKVALHVYTFEEIK